MLDSLRCTFKAVFKGPGYILLFLISSFLFFLLSVWMRNLSFLWNLIFSSKSSLLTKLKVFEWTIDFLRLNYTALGETIMITTAFLVGLNITLLTYYFKRRVILFREAGASAFGVIAGTLGVGCVSCGSVILTSLFGYTASSSFLGAFPLGGLELGIIGVILLSLSIVLIAKKIYSPFVCNPEKKGMPL